MSGETGKPLDAPALLEVLERHRVQYVVVGGYAAELHGSVRRTVDVDVVPRTTADNLERLAAALREVQAKIRTEGFPEGLPFSPSGEAMVGIVMLNLVTKHGELDLNFTPSGTTGYDDLHTGATTFDVGPVHVHVASLADIIRRRPPPAAPRTSTPSLSSTSSPAALPRMTAGFRRPRPGRPQSWPVPVTPTPSSPSPRRTWLRPASTPLGAPPPPPRPTGSNRRPSGDGSGLEAHCTVVEPASRVQHLVLVPLDRRHPRSKNPQTPFEYSPAAKTTSPDGGLDRVLRRPVSQGRDRSDVLP